MAEQLTGFEAGFTRVKRRAKPLVKRAIYRVNRLLGRFDHPIWLIGEGRSGTTWIAGLLNKDGRMLERFEPVHPDKNPHMAAYRKLEYRRPGTQDAQLERNLQQVFAASYWDKWVDQHQRGLLFDGLLVKDVFASLMAKWALERLPDIKPVLLIRNPFAVSRSKVEKVGWLWADDLAPFLADEALMADHLAPFEPILRDVAKRDSAFLTHMAVWSITHFVLFRQFARDELHVVFYEDAVADADRVSADLDSYLGRASSRGTQGWDTSSTSRVSAPDKVERARKDPYGSWRVGLSEEMFAAGMEILQAFGLADLYDDKGRPDIARITFAKDAA